MERWWMYCSMVFVASSHLQVRVMVRVRVRVRVRVSNRRAS
jgi:hypothetical protein